MSGAFTLEVPEIADQMLEISSTPKICDMSDIRKNFNIFGESQGEVLCPDYRSIK
jgi:hypothetical protein